MDMNEVVKGITLTKACSIKPDKESENTKQIRLKVKFDGATLQSVFEKALSGAVIQWQNGQGRKNFDSLKDGQAVEIQFTAPAARAQVDPETAMVLKLQAMTQAEQAEYLKTLMTKAAKA